MFLKFEWRSSYCVGLPLCNPFARSAALFFSGVLRVKFVERFVRNDDELSEDLIRNDDELSEGFVRNFDGPLWIRF